MIASYLGIACNASLDISIRAAHTNDDWLRSRELFNNSIDLIISDDDPTC